MELNFENNNEKRSFSLKKTGGCSISIFVILIILKLCGIINWPWIVIFLPTILSSFKKTGGCSISISAILIILKFCGIINWPWIVIFLPTILSISFFIIAIILQLLYL